MFTFPSISLPLPGLEHPCSQMNVLSIGHFLCALLFVSLPVPGQEEQEPFVH